MFLHSLPIKETIDKNVAGEVVFQCPALGQFWLKNDLRPVNITEITCLMFSASRFFLDDFVIE